MVENVIKNFSLFSFGSNPKLMELIEKLLKENRELQEELRKRERMGFKDKLKIKELELEIKLLRKKLKG